MISDRIIQVSVNIINQYESLMTESLSLILRQSKHEIIHQDVVHKICSDRCCLRFCNMNNLFICENCCSHCDAPVVLETDEGGRKLCSAECLSQFKQVMTSRNIWQTSKNIFFFCKVTELF